MGNQRGRRGVFLSLIVYGFLLPPLLPLPVGRVAVFAALNGIGSVGLLVNVALTNRYFVDKPEAALEDEYDKSEAFLYNILPVPIAERLEQNPDVIAESHSSVTILLGHHRLHGRWPADWNPTNW